MAVGQTRLLIAADFGADAEMLRQLLRDEYPKVALSMQPASFIEDFDRHRLQVLVIVFWTLTAAERWYLGLYRHSAQINAVLSSSTFRSACSATASMPR